MHIARKPKNKSARKPDLKSWCCEDKAGYNENLELKLAELNTLKDTLDIDSCIAAIAGALVAAGLEATKAEATEDLEEDSQVELKARWLELRAERRHAREEHRLDEANKLSKEISKITRSIHRHKYKDRI